MVPCLWLPVIRTRRNSSQTSFIFQPEIIRGRRLPTVRRGRPRLLRTYFGFDAPSIVAFGRDATIYDDIIARLRATGYFTYVDSFEIVGPNRSSDNTYLVSVVPGDAENIDICDPIVIERHSNYELWIDVQEMDPRTRWRVLDLLSNVARNALNGQSLANVTFPALTLIRRYTNGSPRNPNQKLVLTGEFSYEINGFGEFNVQE